MKQFCIVMVIIALLLSTGACKSPAGDNPYSSESQQSDLSSSSSSASESSSLASSSAASSVTSVSQATSTPASSRTSTAPVSSVAASSAPEPSKPLAISDPVINYLLRAYAGKLSGDLYPDAFSSISSEYGCIHIDYRCDTGNSAFYSESIEGPYFSETSGMMKTCGGMSTIPFRKFVLSYLFSGTDPTVYPIDLKGFPVTVTYFKVYAQRSTDLDIDKQNVSFLNFSELRKCTSMEVIYIEDCKGIDMDTFLSMSKLKYLELVNCTTIDSDKVNQLIARGVKVIVRDGPPAG